MNSPEANVADPPTPDAELVQRAKERAGSYAKLAKAIGGGPAEKEQLRRAATGETKEPKARLMAAVEKYLREGGDIWRPPGVLNKQEKAASHPSQPMEVPKEHARDIAFGRVEDHPNLSQITVHPDYVVLGADGLVRFRVSYLVEGVPPIVRRSGPGEQGR
jgi:hypothetical protein